MGLVQLNMKVPDEMETALQLYMRANGIPERSVAARQLLRQALLPYLRGKKRPDPNAAGFQDGLRAGKHQALKLIQSALSDEWDGS